MTTPSQAYKQASNSQLGRDARDTAKSAADAASSIGEQVSDFASDMSRQASKQYGRARDVASDVYDELHAASERNPHLTLGIALGLGFLVGVVLATRR
jgi:ElaB/YqjD/DUF883 family membrane-anchored ribosome-binding protein